MSNNKQYIIVDIFKKLFLMMSMATPKFLKPLMMHKHTVAFTNLKILGYVN